MNPGSMGPIPPLPDFQTEQRPRSLPMEGGNVPDPMLQALMSSVGPVKSAVDSINSAAQQIVQSGSVPGAERICAQIVALATQLLPMAAQQALQPMSQGPSQGPGMEMLPPTAPPTTL